MKNYSERLDAIALTINSNEESTLDYEPKKVLGGSDWMLETPINSN